MEKVNAKRSPKMRGTDFGLRILALIIAIIIWLVLSITQYPTITKSISNVPVVFTLDGTSAAEKGLQAIGYKDISVDVEIKGMNYEIGSYTANDLVATLNVDNVNKEGDYTLDIDVKSSHSSDRVSVVSVSPETVKVSFVRISSDVFNVSASAPNVNAEQGKTLRPLSVSPSEITVEGSEVELKKINKVEAKIDEEMTLTEKTTISTDHLVFYDENNKELDSSKYKVLDAGTFDVTFDIYKKKTVNFAVDFTDTPKGFDVKTIPYHLSEDQIVVITPNLEDSDTQTITLGSVSLRDVKPNATFEFDVDSKITGGEINQSGISKVTMSFDFNTDQYKTSEFVIPASSIQILNAPADKVVSIETKQLPSVTMFGPASAIDQLKESEIIATVDLTDVASTGSITRSVEIYSQRFVSVWCTDEQNVQIEISDKPVVSDDSSSKNDSKKS